MSRERFFVNEYFQNQDKGRAPRRPDQITKTADNDLSARSLPGSDGEHRLQALYGRTSSALAFYRHQVLDYVNSSMQAFIARQEMMFVATADRRGEADASFRAGSPGFVRVLDERTLVYPEYRGNGVMASLGNLSENPHLGMLFIDFTKDKIGLHVNGSARIIEHEQLLNDVSIPDLLRVAALDGNDSRPERWVLVSVAEAYVHCSKHIPLMRKLEAELRDTADNARVKSGDYFAAKSAPRHNRRGGGSSPTEP
jgi:predicted pyridoxine 5'-phosphate oxidase superfamily flavin-nucleotide-binding protein